MVYWRSSVILIFIVLTIYVDIATSKEETVTLPVNGRATVCRRVMLHVNSIEDHRCPAKVTCFWEGQANVQLVLSKTTASSPVKLIIGGLPEDTAQVTLVNNVYTVVLKGVIPYRGTSNAQPRAVIQVTCP